MNHSYNSIIFLANLAGANGVELWNEKHDSDPCIEYAGPVTQRLVERVSIVLRYPKAIISVKPNHLVFAWKGSFLEVRLGKRMGRHHMPVNGWVQ